MDLETREALAFSADRDVALAQLLPGSTDHDYFRCIRAQHQGRLDEAEQIITQWSNHHDDDTQLSRLQLRQWLYRAHANLALVAEKLRDHLGVQHWHQRDVEEIDPTRATKLADDAFLGGSLLAQAVRYDATLSQVTDEGLSELITDREEQLDVPRRRALLQRIGHTPAPGLEEMIALDLRDNHRGFGSLGVHGKLTLAQLHQLVALHSALESDLKWVSAVVQRMVPSREQVDIDLDLVARQTYLEAMWTFVAPLPEVINSLKVHALWHLLETRRKLGVPADAALFATYLALPRHTSYMPRELLANRDSTQIAAVVDFRHVTQLSTVSDDEPLVRALLHELVDRAEAFATWFDRAWLDREIATAHLLAGSGDAHAATKTLGPARAAELRERVELAWCPQCPTQFGATASVVLEADVKNVPELTVKVFRIDPHAYFVHAKREVGADLDLDGLAATEEQVLRFAEPPVRRVRRRIELPACTRAGTYIVDLIGNGMSSRAVIHKGRLRFAMRVGAAGHVVTVVDDAGTPRADAHAIISEREYTADGNGSFVVPFTTVEAQVPMLLLAGDLASVTRMQLRRETPTLAMTMLVDREGITAGRMTQAVVRPRLMIAGAAASLALVKDPIWEVTLTDRAGVQTSKAQPVTLVDDDALRVEWQVADDTQSIAVALRGTIEVRSEQRDVALATSDSFTVSGIHATTAIESLYLARTSGGWVLSALGKTGEPRAQRAVTVTLVHRWSRLEVKVDLATDERGRIELGALAGIARISATLADRSQAWIVVDNLVAADQQVRHGEDVVLPLPPDRSAAEVIRHLSIVEICNGVPIQHPGVTLVSLASGVMVRGLPVGSFNAVGPGVVANVTVVAPAPEIARNVFTREGVFEMTSPAPAIASVTATTELRLQLHGATTATRVHVLPTTFECALIERPQLGAWRSAERTIRPEQGVHYVSGRELGDEYRYVLERKAQQRYPGLLLERPTLLLDPWARRTTSTGIANARLGGAFTPQGPRAGYSARDLATQGMGSRSSDEGYPSYDFLPLPAPVLANLVPDTNGALTIDAAALGGAATAIVVVDDPAGMAMVYVRRPEVPLAPRDLRLRLALDPARHATQTKAITPLCTGERLVIEDLATAKVHIVDSVERAHSYLLSLSDDATLREFAFITKWHTLPDAERRELYSKYACHELRLFLWAKDRPFFTEVVVPYLAHKRTKTFLDHFLQGAELAPWLEPTNFAKLNAVERALLVREVPASAAIARLLADEVALLPPDPARDVRLIDTLLGAATLDGDDEIASAADAAEDRAETAVMAFGGASGGGMPMAPPAAAAPPPPPAPMPAKPMMAKMKQASRARSAEAGAMQEDMSLREQDAAPMFRAVDKTQEWAENNWWHRHPRESTAAMIMPNRLWRDLAAHRRGAFLSPGLGLAATSFAESMCALAVTDLPFVAGAHEVIADGPRLEIIAASSVLAGSSQLVDGELVATGAPLVVGSSFVRTDDRYDWIEGEQTDKYVTGAFATGIVYTLQIVLANPTSARQRIAALVQIPRGSMPVAGARPTQTIDVVLEPYGTHGHEVAFYFPFAGTWSHFPVHASRGGVIVAAAPARDLVVTSGGEAADPRSWPHISQRGSVAEVVAYLATANLGAIQLDKVAWRMRDHAAYLAILAALEARKAFEPTLWGYALVHADEPRVRTFLRWRMAAWPDPGPVLEMLDLDAEDTGAYEHLELAPLINARAHRLGAKLRILNDGLAKQYERFCELVAHRPVPTAEDLVAAASYLLAQGRVELALTTLGRVDPAQLAEQLQHAYLAAYAACLVGDLPRARHLAAPYRDHPVDRWRHKFGALLGMLDEVEGAAPSISDTRSREQQHAELAAKQPSFEIAIDRDGIVLTSQAMDSLELRFFEMDVELLFSRQPFVASDVSRFSFIEPGHREVITSPTREVRVAWPAALRGKNVVVEAVGHGQRKAKVHYANDLVLSLANQVGQVRVMRRSDQRPLAATYVKVYARKHGGAVTFYKDGYTDLRGWFDYASLSTNELDSVDRFAILVCSDGAGAAIVEAAPPQR